LNILIVELYSSNKNDIICEKQPPLFDKKYAKKLKKPRSADTGPVTTLVGGITRIGW
jgi:hypothetical protein